MFLNDEHPSKASSPIFITLFGIVIKKNNINLDIIDSENCVYITLDTVDEDLHHVANK